VLGCADTAFAHRNFRYRYVKQTSGFGCETDAQRGCGIRVIPYALLRLRYSLLAAVLFALSGLGGGLPFAHAQLVVGDGEAEELTGRELVAALGSEPGQVRWSGSGGFATMQGETRVTLNEMEWLIWGSADFVPDGRALVFGRPDSAGTIDWNSRIDLGGSNKKLPRQIRLVRGRLGDRANVVLRLRDALRSTVYEQSKSNWRLDFLGDGRFDILAAQPHLARGDIHVARAELRVAEAGQLNHVRKFVLSRGASFVVDEREAELDRLGAKADLKLDSSTFRYWGGGAAQPDASEHLGRVFLAGGVSTIEVINSSDGRSSVFLKSLARTGGSGAAKAARGVFEIHTRGNFVLSSEQVNPDFEGYGGILPWATINGEDWVARSGKDWVQVNSHYTANESSWEPGHNVTVREAQQLTTDRTINSLRAHGGSLNLGGHTLTVSSGGLIAVGPDFTFGSSDASGDYYRPSIITTGKTRNPLYVHVHTDNVWMQATLTGGMDLVKAGGGVLHLMHGYTGELGDVYMHEGRIEFAAKSKGTLQTGALYVGDGARTAALKLAGRERLSSRPQLSLRGSAHTPVDAGVLELSGATQQSFSRLHVENAAVIDYVDGSVGAENVLFVDELTFNSEAARLVIRHWVRNEDRLIVRRSANLSARAISQIDFEGWGNARLVDYDGDHWEIVSGPLSDSAAAIHAHPAAPLTPSLPEPAPSRASALGSSIYGATTPSPYGTAISDRAEYNSVESLPYVPPPLHEVVSHGVPSARSPEPSALPYSSSSTSGFYQTPTPSPAAPTAPIGSLPELPAPSTSYGAGYQSSWPQTDIQAAPPPPPSAREIEEEIERILYETAYRS